MENFIRDPAVIRKIEEKYGSYYKKRQMIFKEDDNANHFYILRKGFIKIFKTNVTENVTLNIIHADEIFGEMSLLSDHKRTASAETITECFIITLNKEILYTLMDSDKNLILILMKELSSRIRKLSRMVKELSVGDDKHIITTHFANYICMKYIDRYVVDENILDIVRYIYKETGIEKDKIVDILEELQKNEIIQIEKQKIKINDKDLFIKVIPKYF